MVKVLYIHGMGGGGDSRIPAVLNDFFRMNEQKIDVVVRTYDFDPEVACLQIQEWVSELEPRLVIGMSACFAYHRNSSSVGLTCT